MNTKFFSISNLKGVSLLLVAAAMSTSVYAQPTMVNHAGVSVKHRPSYLVERAANLPKFNQEFVQAGSGMTTSPNGTSIQATSTYELTRYVKQGEASPLYLSTSQNNYNPTGHRGYQRWYDYDTQLPLVPSNPNYNNGAPAADNGKPATWDSSNGHTGGFNWVHRYENGWVMSANFNGDTGNGFVRYNFWAILPEGQDTLNVGADLSSYTDYVCTAGRGASPEGDFTEPTLDLRHIYHMIDAKVMAEKLTPLTGANAGWLEEHTIHFPSRSTNVASNNYIDAGDNFVALDLETENYWVFTGNANQHDNDHLFNFAGQNDIVVTAATNYTGGGVEQLGISRIALRNAPNTEANGIGETTYKRRRLVRFCYNDITNNLNATGNTELYLYVRGTCEGVEYNIAKFTIIFDANSETIPWYDVIPANSAKHNRSMENLKLLCNGSDPVARIDFDYPHTSYYTSPNQGPTYINNDNIIAVGDHPFTRTYSSALPLDFGKTSYAYRWVGGKVTGDTNVFGSIEWGGYGIMSKADQGGCHLDPIGTVAGDPNAANNGGFLYVDASDMPGTVATVPFSGTLCAGTRLMCSGWIASIVANAPGSVILKVIGTDADGKEEEVYAFCPGQIGNPRHPAGVTGDAPGNRNQLWQQFYFEFLLDKAYMKYELRIENNCIDTNGGDYFLDDVWVYARKPELLPTMGTPLCGTSVQFLRLSANFDALKEALALSGYTPQDTNIVTIAYLDKDKLPLVDGEYPEALSYDQFKDALVGTESFDENGGAYHQFQWSLDFENNATQPVYNLVDAVSDSSKYLYRFVDPISGAKYLIFNGNKHRLTFEEDKTYVVLYALGKFDQTEFGNAHTRFFNSVCSNRTEITIESHWKVITDDVIGVGDDGYEMCSGVTSKIAFDLQGLDPAGAPIDITQLNYDWWFGFYGEEEDENGNFPYFPATYYNYNNLKVYTEGDNSYSLSQIMSYFRLANIDATQNDVLYSDSINSIKFEQGFTKGMLFYLQQQIMLGNMAINSKTFDLPGDMARCAQRDGTISADSTENVYLHFLSIPITDEVYEGMIDSLSTDTAAHRLVYFCHEPQELFIKLTEVAPTMLAGFADYDYSSLDDNPKIEDKTLSVRMSKSQFKQVSISNETDGENGIPGGGDKKLHLRVRGVDVQSADANHLEPTALAEVYLLKTDDPDLQQKVDDAIFDEDTLGLFINRYPVGKINYLYAIKGNNAAALQANQLSMQFTKAFEVREGYEYELMVPFKENAGSSCNGNMRLLLKIVPDYQVWTGDETSTEWNQDDNWRRADWDELQASNSQNGNDRLFSNEPTAANYYMTNAVNYITDAQKVRRRGFAPLYCTRILFLTGNEETDPIKKLKINAPVMYDVTPQNNENFPWMNPETASPLLRYDFQTNEVSNVSEHDKTGLGDADEADLVVEEYNPNICDEVVFQPRTELVNPHFLTYDKAWVEFEVEKNSWQMVSSPLQGTLSGEWYAPKVSARQNTTYFEPINFDIAQGVDDSPVSYDRYSPAVYQRAWDKANAVLYEKGATWDPTDGEQVDKGDANTGAWAGATGIAWEGDADADEYLQRLSYKPFGAGKANVAIRGNWSNVYNDNSVDYDNGGFSVMVINYLKNDDEFAGQKALFRLPKEDKYYDIWDWSQKYDVPDRTRFFVKDADNTPAAGAQFVDLTVPTHQRWKLRTDAIGNTKESAKPYEVTLKNEGNGSLGYFLAPNPFICGLDLTAFYTANKDKITNEVHFITNTGTDVYAYAEGKWTKSDGTTFDGVVKPGEAFFLTALADRPKNELVLTYDTTMMTAAFPYEASGANPIRERRTTRAAETPSSLVITAQRGRWKSHAMVTLTDRASNTFVENEDVATFIDENIIAAPTVYTLCGRLATTINRVHDFHVLPIGIESNSQAPCTLTFSGVETLGESLMLYDAKDQTTTPIEEGTTVEVPGSTQNRFYIVTAIDTPTSLNDANIVIEPQDDGVKVLSTTGAPITEITIYDLAGRLMVKDAPATSEYKKSLLKGVYVVKASTDTNKLTKKVIIAAQ